MAVIPGFPTRSFASRGGTRYPHPTTRPVVGFGIRGTTSMLHNGIISVVGDTPIARLERLFPDDPIEVYAKLEMLNPSGSSKDRTAVTMVAEAFERGLIGPGTTVVESSSGNLGIGLAQVCRFLGLRFVCVVDLRITPTNLAILKAYGAEVVVVDEPDPVTGDLLTARIERVKAICRATPDCFWVNQYANEGNPRAHRQTMREIHEAIGQIDYLFLTTSTCGTLRGCREYVREHGLMTKVIAVDAAGSVIFGGRPRPRLLPGHGASRMPELYERGLEHHHVHVTDLDCVVGCLRLMLREAIFAGGSSGGIVMAMTKLRDEIPRGSTCVAILCDRGERYLDTIYSPEWVESHFGGVSHLWE